MPLTKIEHIICLFFWLFVASLVCLKLSNIITWSWVWVTSPVWGLCALFFGLMLGISVLCALIDSPDNWKEHENQHTNDH